MRSLSSIASVLICQNTSKSDIQGNKRAPVLINEGCVAGCRQKAGIVVSSYFWEHTNDEIERTMRINSEAVMYICRAFLPGMMEKGEGRIVNMSSSAGNRILRRLRENPAQRRVDGRRRG